ncbi:MAG TPA: hypothetical protein GX731_06230 [Clostridiales bacterium]|nr:hypothetical protein [Clostridiales bacterium]
MHSRSQRHDFAKRQVFKEDWYDMYEDWGLIEASFTAQYGIRLRNEHDMPWSEFSTLLSGIMPDTPLGKVVSTRSESDKDTLKNFTKDQHKIRNEWINRNNKKMMKLSDAQLKEMTKGVQEALRKAFS